MYHEATPFTVLICNKQKPIQKCSVTRVVLRNFTKFTGKYLCQSHFFIKKETVAQVFSFGF